MVRTKEEIIGAIKDRFGEETDDALIGIIEDVSDTLDDLTPEEDWKEKYEENDREWRKKYTERFTTPVEVVEETEDVVEEVSAPKTFEDLFTNV